jgi:peptidoglycan/LPS O-acetylase OafA/YrhL
VGIAVGLAIPFFSQISVRWLVLPCHLIAKYSYGIYLTHLFCIWLVYQRLHSYLPKAGRFALFVILVIGIPIFFYHFLEEPMVLLGKEVAMRCERITTGVMALGRSS